jgi:hypothetical protein
VSDTQRNNERLLRKQLALLREKVEASHERERKARQECKRLKSFALSLQDRLVQSR